MKLPTRKRIQKHYSTSETLYQRESKDEADEKESSKTSLYNLPVVVLHAAKNSQVCC
jgi:hypothetical protein